MAERNLYKENQGEDFDFKILVDQYQERVLNLCYRFVNHREDAEDVAQDVFVEIYRSIGNFRNDAKLSTWIHRIAVNKSLDFVRKRNRKKRFGQVKYFLGLEEVENQLRASPDSQPEVVLETKECAAILRQAVASLSKKQRTAIILNKFEGFSYAEVADVMETTVSAVDSLIQRGLKNLRKKLYRYYEEDFKNKKMRRDL